MRSIKKMALLAVATAVVAAFAAPAMASASNWTKNGVEIKGVHWSQEGSMSLSGTLKLAGGVGTVECPVNATVSFGSGSSGQVTAFSGTPAGCAKPGGTIGALCTEVTGITAGSLPWAATATESGGKKVIKLEGMKITYKFSAPGKENCLEMPFTGTLTATPDNAGAISSVSLSGDMSYGSNKVAGSGTLSASPAGKYGITSAETATVSGTISMNGSASVSCQANGSVSLEPGSEGKFTSFTANECSSGGWIAICGIKSLTVNTMPTLVDQGTSIAVKNISFGVGTAGCGYAGPFVGEMTATPDKTTAISSTSLSGILASGPVNVAWSGNLNWTPAAVYGL